MYEQGIFEKETEKVFGCFKIYILLSLLVMFPPRLQLEGYCTLPLVFSLALNLLRY